MIEHARFTDSPLRKALKEQRKIIEAQGIKHAEALKALKSEENQELESIEGPFPTNMRRNEIKNKIDEIRKWEEKINRKNLKYKTAKY